MTQAALLYQPYPPRYRWLLRLSISSVVVVVLISGFWFIVDRRASARVQRELDEIRARGEPTQASDFNGVMNVPNERNIVTCLTNANSVHSSAYESPESTNMIVPDSLPMSDEWYTVARKAESGNAACLNALKPLTTLTEADWHLTYRSPLSAMLLRWLNDDRELANLLGDMVILHHLDGNDMRSLDEINELMTIADVVGKSPFLVSGLVGIGIDALAMQQLEIIAPALSVKGAPGATTQPAERQQVEHLIARLLRGRGTMRSYLVGERVCEIDYAQTMGGRTVLLRPLFNKMISDLLATWPAILAASEAPTEPIAQAQLKGSVVSTRPILPTYFSVSQGRSITTNARVTFEMRVAAISLACRLYHLDKGHWPKTLQDLVPAYLPAVPNDPLAPKVQPIGYQIIGENRPIVFSVTQDDQGLNPSQAPAVGAPPMYGWQSWKTYTLKRDVPQWRDLSIREHSPTTEPNDSNLN